MKTEEKVPLYRLRKVVEGIVGSPGIVVFDNSVLGKFSHLGNHIRMEIEEELDEIRVDIRIFKYLMERSRERGNVALCEETIDEFDDATSFFGKESKFLRRATNRRELYHVLESDTHHSPTKNRKHFRHVSNLLKNLVRIRDRFAFETTVAVEDLIPGDIDVDQINSAVMGESLRAMADMLEAGIRSSLPAPEHMWNDEIIFGKVYAASYGERRVYLVSADKMHRVLYVGAFTNPNFRDKLDVFHPRNNLKLISVHQTNGDLVTRIIDEENVWKEREILEGLYKRTQPTYAGIFS